MSDSLATPWSTWNSLGQNTGVGIPGMGEPGGLLSMGSHRVGHDRSDLAAAAVAIDKYLFTHNSEGHK